MKIPPGPVHRVELRDGASSQKSAGSFASINHGATSIVLCLRRNKESAESNPGKTGNARVKMIVTEPGKDKLLPLMLCISGEPTVTGYPSAL